MSTYIFSSEYIKVEIVRENVSLYFSSEYIKVEIVRENVSLHLQ